MMLRQGMRGDGPRGSTRGMGSWFSDMVSNINWNPMASPVTQAVVGGAVTAVTGVVQAVTAPVVAVASAVGVDLNPTHSPVFNQVIKPAGDLLGTALIGVPLGSAAATVGSMVGSSQDRMTGSGVYAPRSYAAPAPVYVGAPAAPVAGPTAPGALPKMVAAPLPVAVGGYRRSTWPSYYVGR